MNLEDKYINHIIFKSCTIKSEIVSLDEKERGIRSILNLGHTFGHAFESILKYNPKLIHGEAVSIGICLAYKFSVKLGYCPASEADKVEKLFSAYNLPINSNFIKSANITPSNVLKKLYKDKKVEKGKITLILTKGIGNCFIKNGVNDQKILKFLKVELNA